MNPDLQPPGSSVFESALQWLEATLLGTIATTVAVIAVASVGLLLLSGRIDVRRAAQVIFGCFILFGASTIAQGIVHATADSGDPAQLEAPSSPPLQPLAAAAMPNARPTAPYDPYAGAALPSRR